MAQVSFGGEIRQGAVTMSRRLAYGTPQPLGEGVAGIVLKFGVAVLNGVVMVNAINQNLEGDLSMAEAVCRGALSGLRPVLMTAAIAALGFIPMPLASGVGSEVQRPLAAVVVGELASSTFLTLFVLPALFPLFSKGVSSVHRSCNPEESGSPNASKLNTEVLRRPLHGTPQTRLWGLDRRIPAANARGSDTLDLLQSNRYITNLLALSLAPLFCPRRGVSSRFDNGGKRCSSPDSYEQGVMQ